MQTLKKNRVFRFLASLRMAVILMVALAIIVSVATVIESRYNAQIAGILVYKSYWFAALTTLLWVNVFCSTLMRFPFKASQTGFVITHVGLLMLLAGGLVTGEFGIDGQLRVVEGQSSNIVGLPELSLKVANAKSDTLQSYKLRRSLETKTGKQLGLSGFQDKTGLIVEKYLPFVVREQGYADHPGDEGGPAINFSLESQMFGAASEWLHSKDRPRGQMGPALLELIVEDSAKPTVPEKKSKQAQSSGDVSRNVASATTSAANGSVLLVRDQTGAELGKVSLSDLRKGPRKVKGHKITLVKEFEQASVVENKLVERGEKGANPALEVKIETGGKSVREVAFAKYPDFSMGASASVGLKLEYQVAGTETQSTGGMPSGHPHGGAGAETAAAEPAQNRIEFRVEASALKSASSGAELPMKVVLYRNGKQVFDRPVKAGETIETPWMGMKIKLDSVMRNAVAVDQVKPTEMRPRSNIPDSAILIRHSSDDPSKAVWVVEGDFKTIGSGDKAFEVYYGMETVELPFTIQLEKFEKVDYPGTETPMSFQSTIRMNGAGEPILISMNEPLKASGFTLYQSSYEMGPGMPTASIFSVNKDPGRGLKYFGSLVLCIGIALFALMRSRWYNEYRQRRHMKTQIATLLVALLSVTAAPSLGFAQNAPDPADPHAGHNHAPGDHSAHDHAAAQLTPEQAKERFTAFAKRIESKAIAEFPIQSHGRLKPLDSYTREAVLYLTGKYRFGGMEAIQIYLGMMMSEAAEDFELINLRDPKLRTRLGFASNARHVSLRALQGSQLEALAQPALQRQERDSKSLSGEEKSLVEVMQQVWLARGIISGGHLMQGIQPQGKGGEQAPSPVVEKLQVYFRALVQGEAGAQGLAAEAIAVARAQPYPELIRRNLDRMGLEVWYNKAHLFFWVGVAYFMIGLCLLVPMVRRKLSKKGVLAAVAVPFLAHSAGFAIRVVITGFAPVTNMYGTMIWVAFGVVLFGALLYLLYKHDIVFGIIMVGAAITLFITESLPLVLSPDMDPIVAVLRSNFWLSTHVLTITISYAGFTIAMLLGNVAIFRRIVSAFRPSTGAIEKDEKFYKEYGHLTYRVMQLGVFFLTTGIILGGIWADYSWGRFWGWDPKETWSLIALLGYLAILHAKHSGWLKSFGILAAAPVAYLLVVMAWYGVNFILAAGLHSYGFSSGGAAAVGGFVLTQLVLLSIAGAVHHMKNRDAGVQKAGA